MTTYDEMFAWTFAYSHSALGVGALLPTLPLFVWVARFTQIVTKYQIASMEVCTAVFCAALYLWKARDQNSEISHRLFDGAPRAHTKIQIYSLTRSRAHAHCTHMHVSEVPRAENRVRLCHRVNASICDTGKHVGKWLKDNNKWNGICATIYATWDVVVYKTCVFSYHGVSSVIRIDTYCIYECIRRFDIPYSVYNTQSSGICFFTLPLLRLAARTSYNIPTRNTTPTIQTQSLEPRLIFFVSLFDIT